MPQRPLSPTFREPMAAALPRLHAFAFLATGSRDAARNALQALASELDEVPGETRTAVDPEAVLLIRLTRLLQDRLGRKATADLAELESLLRTDLTRDVDVDAPPICGDLKRLPVLEAEVQRACLVYVLSALPPQLRLAFLLVDVLGRSPSLAVEALGSTELSIATTLSRVRSRLLEYLEPRCRYLDPGNPCSCSGRLGVALHAKFVQLPAVEEPPLPTTPVDGPGLLFRRLLALRAPSLESILELSSAAPRPARGRKPRALD